MLRIINEDIENNLDDNKETLDEIINRAHKEELGAIDTYNDVLNKTDEETDVKLIEMINEIKRDEEDHELLLKHYIETGEALTDEELEKFKEDNEDNTENIIR